MPFKGVLCPVELIGYHDSVVLKFPHFLDIDLSQCSDWERFVIDKKLQTYLQSVATFSFEYKHEDGMIGKRIVNTLERHSSRNGVFNLNFTWLTLKFLMDNEALPELATGNFPLISPYLAFEESMAHQIVTASASYGAIDELTDYDDEGFLSAYDEYKDKHSIQDMTLILEQVRDVYSRLIPYINPRCKLAA